MTAHSLDSRATSRHETEEALRMDPALVDVIQLLKQDKEDEAKKLEVALKKNPMQNLTVYTICGFWALMIRYANLIRVLDQPIL